MNNNTTMYSGMLEIDHAKGVITFTTGGTEEGMRILRITHLNTPIPRGYAVDMVAISQVTSYTQLQELQESQDA